MDKSRGAPIVWHDEFAKVISCAKCDRATDRHLMRDSREHVPQPGYIGRSYDRTGLLLVGQNPYVPNSNLAAQDREYTAALRGLRDAPTEQQYAELQDVLDRFIPKWPVQNNYFPLAECGLRLEDIAYLNLVRCRTGEHAPNSNTVAECGRTHFEPWLEMLKPSCVVFIGLWACERGQNAVASHGIPSMAIDRNRSLNSEQRNINRAVVAAFVHDNIRLQHDGVAGSTRELPSTHRPGPTPRRDAEMDPNQTLALLDELEALGFNNDAFAQLHHFILREKHETIASFRAYCRKLCGKEQTFKPAGTNERVHQRLVFVLAAYQERGMRPGNQTAFTNLAKEAFRKIPPL